MTTKTQANMTKNSAKPAQVLLRRPIAPPIQTKPALPEKPKTGASSFLPFQSQSIPSFLELSQEFSEHHQLLAPSLPSDAQSVASDLIEDVYAPQNTPRAKEMALRSDESPSFQSLEEPPDWRFIIESRYNMNKGNAPGRTLESDSLVKPYKPRGPEPFPLRQPKQPSEILPEILYADVDDPRFFEIPEFTLNDFCYDLSRVYALPTNRVKNIVFSKQNFKKMTTLFGSFAQEKRQEKVKTLELKGEDIPTFENRVPQHQVLLEMACAIEDQMRQLMLEDVQSQLHGTQAKRTPGSAGSMSVDGKSLPPIRRDKDSLYSAPISKYLQGSRRSNGPFDGPGSDSEINPSELALLECLVNGGLALSLKAHFISTLPQLNPILKTLTYLNLSFNDFKNIPVIVFEIENLQILKLRNNPIREIPYEIGQLTKLRTLVLSFCILSDLPPTLFTLPIKYLDLSFNKLSFLPNEMRHLKRLRAVNLEGNQLAALPCGMLKLRDLRYLRVINNFMHPLLWKENSQNNPQRLSDMAALVCKQEGLDCVEGLHDSLTVFLNSYTTCDCCGGPLYGPGIRLIRPCRRAYGVKQVPFIFISCSPACRDFFMVNTQSLSDILYDDESDEEFLE